MSSCDAMSARPPTTSPTCSPSSASTRPVTSWPPRCRPRSSPAAALDLPGGVSEMEALAKLRAVAARNRRVTSLIGMGYTGTITPPVIARNVLENPSWYTAYTPYQPEISQGRLEALLNFQTLITELTGLDVTNASLLDEATAAAEAMTMARRQSKSSSNRFVVHHDTHPQTIAVLRTRAEPVGIELVVGDVEALDDADGLFGALFSLPASSGAVIDWTTGHRTRPRARRDRRGGHRSTGLRPHHSPGSARRRHRRRLRPTIRRADGLRRTTRRLHRCARAVSALDARADRRRQHGHRRAPGAAPRAADARATHPSREGHLEHLHRAGTARQHRRVLRRVARPRRTHPDRRTGPAAHVDRCGRPARRRGRRGERHLVRHAAPAGHVGRCCAVGRTRGGLQHPAGRRHIGVVHVRRDDVAR